MTDPIDQPASKPKWWAENQAIRDRYDLPEYDAPRFEDGTYTYEIVPELEAELGCEIQFIGLNVRYPEDWSVRIDRRTGFPIGCRRDKRGNMIYEMTSERFRDAIISAIERPE